jgi:hypothetical protein
VAVHHHLAHYGRGLRRVLFPFNLAGNVLLIKSGEVHNFETDNHWTFVIHVADGAGLYSDLPSSISL